MRVSPLLCDAPYTKERPIFNNTGCLYPSGFMVQSSPRCQTNIWNGHATMQDWRRM
jgi:hypothetical protein